MTDELTSYPHPDVEHSGGALGVCKREIVDLSYDEMREFVQSLGQPPYRAGQLLKWIYNGLATSFDEMTDLPVEFRQALSGALSLPVLKVVDERVSKDGTTRKVLFRMNDDKTIESCLMKYPGPRLAGERATVCLSTQIGCSVGCPFCATGQQGFERNLSVGEMVGQVLHFLRVLASSDERGDGGGRTQYSGHLTNVVFMGMGEPLANYDSVVNCIRILNSQHGLAIGRRQITVSTVGLVPQIKRLSREPIHVELAVSLHAASDSVRDLLVPVNRNYPLPKLLSACAEYSRTTGRRPSFEYVLFDGINDSVSDAARLVKLLGKLDCHVNLIAGNPTANKKFKPPPTRKVETFRKELTSGGVSNTLRLYRGIDIEAGCGQLRSRWRLSQGQIA